MKVITDKISYYAHRNICSISKYTECLDKYSKNFDNEISLNTKSVIFLDTNVLLRYYSISFTAREKLYDFINQNHTRIILSSQVQYEFLKNREGVIQQYFEQVTNKIPKDFNSDIVNKMKSFLETHKVVLKDYPFVETGIQKHQTELEELLNKLNDTAEQKRKENINLIVKDRFLDLLNSCVMFEGLIEEEVDLIKKDFDLLSKSISLENLDAIINKSNNSVFPGLGDIKNKPDDPYGDYIIYHEMMKYIMTHKSDVIFLTFDNSKGDWMSKTKSPHLHYIQNMYSNTNQILYILDAERTLGDLLNINIKSLVTIENNIAVSQVVTVESLQNLTGIHKIFSGSRPANIDDDLVKEIVLAGYNSIKEIETDLDKGILAYQESVKQRGREYNYMGTLRVCLRIVNINYKYVVEDGQVNDISKDMISKYAEFRKLIS